MAGSLTVILFILFFSLNVLDFDAVRLIVVDGLTSVSSMTPEVAAGISDGAVLFSVPSSAEAEGQSEKDKESPSAIGNAILKVEIMVPSKWRQTIIQISTN